LQNKQSDWQVTDSCYSKLGKMKSFATDFDGDDSGAGGLTKPWSADQAQAWRASNYSISPWRVLAWQIFVGLLVAVLAGVLTGRQATAWSALYGAAAVVIPGALFARGMTSKLGAMHIGAAITGFFVWEMVKIVVCVALLMAAPKILTEPIWLALLVGMVLTMKVYWLALFVPFSKKFKH
jgi:ATP synthase protein I